MDRKHLKQCVVSLAVLLTIGFVVENKITATTQEQKPPQSPAPPGQVEKPAEEVYKNIQIFKGAPASRLMGAMNFFARSLGVECSHCHIPNEFEKDEKAAKQTARKMYAMVRLAQKESGQNSVSCYMCHRGKVQPEPPAELSKEKITEMMKEADKDKRPVDEVYKNIQVFKGQGIPAGRLMMIMQMFTKALGVDCAHCHVANEFEKDEKAAKQTARKMLRMVGSISREIYKGPTPVNCYTCHRGQAKPVAFPPRPGN
jgi:hypothetical protein